MESQVAALGIGDIKAAFRLIDRVDKLPAQAWEEYGVKQGLTVEQVKNLRALLDDKELWRKSDELIQFFDALDALGVRDYFEYEPTVVRGLDYYTRIVMEARIVTASSAPSSAAGVTIIWLPMWAGIESRVWASRWVIW